MTRTSALALVLVTLGLGAAATPGAQTPSAAALLAAASEKATVDGDLPGAIATYQQVVDQFARSDRASAAAALVRMGDCYQKAGDNRAAAMYERVVAEFADVADAATMARSRLAARPTAIEPKLLCDTCGDSNASVTPDGKSLVYIGDSDAVTVRRFGSDTGTRLTHDAPDQGFADGRVVLSSDGQQIALGWDPDRDDAGYEMRLMRNTPGAAPRTILKSKDFNDLVPSGFAPDGRLLIQAQTQDRKWQLAWLSPGSSAMTPIANLGWRIQGDVHEAAVSPDGRYVAFSAKAQDDASRPQIGAWTALAQEVSPKPDTHVYVVAAGGGPAVDLTTAGRHERSPVWLDNTRLLFTSDAEGTWDLWTRTIRDGTPVGPPALVKRNLGDSKAVGLTKTGTYVFYRLQEGTFESLLTSLPAGGGRPAAATDRLIGRQPSWSPDGKSIAIFRRRPPEAATTELVVRNVDTGAERYYDHEGLTFVAALWSHDGKSLFVIVSSSRSDINWYRVALDTGSFQRVAPQRDDGTPADWWSPTLSPDDRTVYSGAASEAGRLDRLVALDLASGRFRVVARFPKDLGGSWDALGLAISPDGTRLAVMTADEKKVSHLAVIGVDGQGRRELTAVPNAAPSEQVSWTADGRTIFFARTENPSKGHSYRVMRIAVDGGQPEDTGVVLNQPGGIQVSPDGTRVLSSALGPIGRRDEMWSLDVAAILKMQRPGTAR